MQSENIFNSCYCVRAMQFHCCAETLQKEKKGRGDHYEKKIATTGTTPTFSDVQYDIFINTIQYDYFAFIHQYDISRIK